MLWLIGIVFIPVVILYGILKFYFRENDFWPKRGVRLVRRDEIVASLFDRLTFKYPFQELDGRIYKKLKSENLRFGGIGELQNSVFFPVDVELIKRIMVKDFEYFVNRRVLETQKRDKLMNKMMTVKENQEWKDLRSTISPAFSTGKIRRMFDIFEQCSTRTNIFIEKAIASSNSEIDLTDAATRYTLDVIAWAAFGVDSKVFDDKDSIFSKMGSRFERGFHGVLGLFKILLVMIVPKIGALLRVSIVDRPAGNFFNDVIKKTIKHRQQTGERRQDFLQLMIDAQAGQLKDEVADDNIDDQFEKDAKLSENSNKIKITEDIIVSQCLLFFLAGFSTTQNLISFAAFELALNPDIQDKLAKEVQKASDINGGKLTYDIVNSLEYLDKVICETLRKYPPGFRTERVATLDYKVPESDVIVPKDTIVLISIWGIHYDPEFYPDPHKFDPERFTPENKAKRHPCTYLPFGAGPRNCIAMRFALMEGKTAIAKLVQNFILEPSAKTTIPLKFGKFNLKPEEGMWMNLKVRNPLKSSEE